MTEAQAFRRFVDIQMTSTGRPKMNSTSAARKRLPEFAGLYAENPSTLVSPKREAIR